MRARCLRSQQPRLTTKLTTKPPDSLKPMRTSPDSTTAVTCGNGSTRTTSDPLHGIGKRAKEERLSDHLQWDDQPEREST